MGTLNIGPLRQLGKAWRWSLWEVRRLGRDFMRRQGGWGVGVLLSLLLLVAAVGVERFCARLARSEQARSSERAEAPALTMDIDWPSDHERLQRFEALLLDHDDLPTQVQDLLKLADTERLLALRGEYRPQLDGPGRFLRYRVNLPVRGDPAAVHRFIENALRGQAALGLESVQFQRQSVESPEVEARLQWVILARPPHVGRPATSDVGGGP